MTDLLAAEKRVNVSTVKHLAQHIDNSMLILKDDDTDLAKGMKEKIYCDLLWWYSNPEVNRLQSMCSLLDPGFRNRLAEADKLATL